MTDITEALTVAAARESFLNKYDINSNILETSKYIFVTHNLPFLNFFAQSVQTPSISTNEVFQDTPYSIIYRAGDKLMYEPLTATFLIDEDLKVWEEIYNWMRGYTYPTTREEYRAQAKKGIYADMSILFLKNSHESNLSFRLHDCFPTSIGPINFDSTADAGTVMTTDVTFRFSTFEIVR